jgi:hypothetical protein
MLTSYLSALDGIEFVLDQAVAFQSELIKDMINGQSNSERMQFGREAPTAKADSTSRSVGMTEQIARMRTKIYLSLCPTFARRSLPKSVKHLTRAR